VCFFISLSPSLFLPFSLPSVHIPVDVLLYSIHTCPSLYLVFLPYSTYCYFSVFCLSVSLVTIQCLGWVFRTKGSKKARERTLWKKERMWMGLQLHSRGARSHMHTRVTPLTHILITSESHRMWGGLKYNNVHCRSLNTPPLPVMIMREVEKISPPPSCNLNVTLRSKQGYTLAYSKTRHTQTKKDNRTRANTHTLLHAHAYTRTHVPLVNRSETTHVGGGLPRLGLPKVTFLKSLS